jgi:hypothetical protein
VFNLGPDLRLGVFDLASQATDQLFPCCLLLLCQAAFDHLTILTLRTLIHTGVTGIAAGVCFRACNN